MDRNSWLMLSACLLMTAGLAGCGTESAHSAAAPIPSTKSKHHSRLGPSRTTPEITHPSTSPPPQAKPSPATTAVHQTVAISLAPMANFPEVDQHIFQTLQLLTSVPLVAPTVLAGGATDAEVTTTPHGYEITWYNDMASPAMNGSDTILDQSSLSNIPMAAYVGAYSYSLFGTNQQASQALLAMEESRQPSSRSQEIAIHLTTGPEVQLNPKTSSATWRQMGWHCSVNNEVFNTNTAILKMANQMVTVMRSLHAYPHTTQSGYIAQSLLPTMEPVSMTWVDGRALFSIGLDQGTLQDV